MDYDDYYSPEWIKKSVENLLHYNADLVGLRQAYFFEKGKMLRLYNKFGQQPYVLEATMCYTKKMWERNHFPDTSRGEGIQFCTKAGRIYNHNLGTDFMAIIHGNNTCSHEMLSMMMPQHYTKVKDILGTNYERFI